jgi:hypothetical protein
MSDDSSSISEVFSDDEIEALQSTPPEIVIANHLFHLLELAAIHLSAAPPNFEWARLVIDAVQGMIEAVDDRLGEPGPVIAEGLVQLQTTYDRLWGFASST